MREKEYGTSAFFGETNTILIPATLSHELSFLYPIRLMEVPLKYISHFIWGTIVITSLFGRLVAECESLRASARIFIAVSETHIRYCTVGVGPPTLPTAHSGWVEKNVIDGIYFGDQAHVVMLETRPNFWMKNIGARHTLLLGEYLSSRLTSVLLR